MGSRRLARGLPRYYCLQITVVRNLQSLSIPHGMDRLISLSTGLHLWVAFATKFNIQLLVLFWKVHACVLSHLFLISLFYLGKRYLRPFLSWISINIYQVSRIQCLYSGEWEVEVGLQDLELEEWGRGTLLCSVKCTL